MGSEKKKQLKIFWPDVAQQGTLLIEKMNDQNSRIIFCCMAQNKMFALLVV